MIEGVLRQNGRTGLQMRLEQFQHRQIEAERAIQQHQVDLAAHVGQRLPRIAYPDVDQIGESCRFQIGAGAGGFAGLQLGTNQMSTAHVA